MVIRPNSTRLRCLFAEGAAKGMRPIRGVMLTCNVLIGNDLASQGGYPPLRGAPPWEPKLGLSLAKVPKCFARVVFL